MGIVFYFTAQPRSFLVFGVHDDKHGYVVQNRSWFGILFYHQAVMRFQTGSSITNKYTHGAISSQLQELLQAKLLRFDELYCWK